MPGHAAHEKGFLVVDGTADATAPRHPFRRRNGRRVVGPRAIRRRLATERARRRGDRPRERAVLGTREHDAERDEAEVAVDHALAASRDAFANEREAFDVLVEERPIIGARRHPGDVREEIAYGRRARRRTAPFGDEIAERCVERERATLDRAEGRARDEDLRERGDVERRRDLGRGRVRRAVERAVRALEDERAVAFDA